MTILARTVAADSVRQQRYSAPLGLPGPHCAETGIGPASSLSLPDHPSRERVLLPRVIGCGREQFDASRHPESRKAHDLPTPNVTHTADARPRVTTVKNPSIEVANALTAILLHAEAIQRRSAANGHAEIMRSASQIALTAQRIWVVLGHGDRMTDPSN